MSCLDHFSQQISVELFKSTWNFLWAKGPETCGMQTTSSWIGIGVFWLEKHIRWRSSASCCNKGSELPPTSHKVYSMDQPLHHGFSAMKLGWFLYSANDGFGPALLFLIRSPSYLAKSRLAIQYQHYHYSYYYCERYYHWYYHIMWIYIWSTISLLFIII